MYKFTKKAQKIIETSKQIAKTYKTDYITTGHLLVATFAVGHSFASTTLEEKGLTTEKINTKVKEFLSIESENQFITKVDNSVYTPRVVHIFNEALQTGTNLISTEHILIGILSDSNSIAYQTLMALNVDPILLVNEAKELLEEANSHINKRPWESVFSKPDDNSNQTSTLTRFSRDFTSYAKENRFDPTIGRNTEIKRIIQIMSRRTKNNPILIGEPGVGKTAIVEGLAQKIIQGDVPDILKEKRIVSLDLSSMVAGSKHRGDFEERMKQIIDELEQNTNIILFLDEMHTLIGAGGAEGSMDASNMLKPALSRGHIQVVGATTIEEYRKHIEANGALERRFQPVKIEEPTEAQAIEILYGLRKKYEDHHSIHITDKAIEASVTLSARYINDRFLPDKAIDLLDESASNISLKKFTSPRVIRQIEQQIENLKKEKEIAIVAGEFNNAKKINDQQYDLELQLITEKNNWISDSNKPQVIAVNEEEIAQIVTSWTGIPIKKLQLEEQNQLVNLEDLLHNRIKGQRQAVASIARAIRRSRVGIKDPKRPVGSFLFLGPTGVGKTELSKALANVLFGTDDAILRLDMSEYMEKNSINKLIGPPPGYVGYDQGNHFTEKVRRKPYSIILFDEIEKAHPDIFNLLLQVLDDGVLTDSQGRKINFKNTVIIMTSNAGANSILNVDENTDYDQLKETVMTTIQTMFAPEFLNRIDDIIVFHSLSKSEIKDIARSMIKQVQTRVKATSNMILEITENAMDTIAALGYDVTYGARPLRRVIQTQIEDKLAEEVLKGNLSSDSHVVVDTTNVDTKNQIFYIKEKRHDNS